MENVTPDLSDPLEYIYLPFLFYRTPSPGFLGVGVGCVGVCVDVVAICSRCSETRLDGGVGENRPGRCSDVQDMAREFWGKGNNAS